MPNYDYKCQNCGQITEIFHSIKKNFENKSCSKCKKGKLKRIISKETGSNIIFKGEGFYRSTDYINQKAKEEGTIHDDKKKIKRESL